MPALGETAQQRRETESGQNPGLGKAVCSRCTPSHPLRIDLRTLLCVLFAGTAHYPLRSPAPSNAQALTTSRPDGTFQFFPNRNRAAMRWSVMLGVAAGCCLFLLKRTHSLALS